MTRLLKNAHLSILLLSLVYAGCTSTLFESIGSNLSAPISVAVDAANNRAYVVNANLEYKYLNGSVMVLDITDPTSPSLLSGSGNPVATKNYSGQIYFDAATSLAYISNRESDNSADTVDQVIVVNFDEASSSFMSVSEYSAEEDPFGVACCDAAGRMYVVASGSGSLDVYTPSDMSSYTSLSLTVTLTIDGEAASVTGTSASRVAVLGDQAFVSAGGMIYVVNLNEVSGGYPVDYVVSEYTDDGVDDLGTARDIAAATDVDGNNWIYVVHTSATDGTNALLIINAASLVAVDPDSSSPGQVEASSVISKSIAVGSDPNGLAIFDTDGDGFADRAYVTNTGDDTVSVVDLTSGELVTTITLNTGSLTADEPYGVVAFTHAGGSPYLYVTNLASDNISIIDIATNAVVANYP